MTTGDEEFVKEYLGTIGSEKIALILTVADILKVHPKTLYRRMTYFREEIDKFIREKL
ncbi:MAG TPA: hypothetical protein VIH27_00790 [Nitrososphaerales archaeon]